MEKIKRSNSLTECVYDQLIHEISQMKPGDNRLPSEDELAHTLGVSRATIREALKNLAMRRLVSTVHGKGTFAHPAVLNVKNRLDVESDFISMLEQQFPEVVVGQTWTSHSRLTDFAKKAFGSEDADAVTTRWIYEADGTIMLFGRYHILHKFITREPGENDHYASLPDFSMHCMNSMIDYCAMYSIIKNDKDASSVFRLSEVTPFLCWEEDIYDLDDQKVGVGEVFVHPDNISLSVVSKLNH